MIITACSAYLAVMALVNQKPIGCNLAKLISEEEVDSRPWYDALGTLEVNRWPVPPPVAAGIIEDCNELQKLFGVAPLLVFVNEKDRANAFATIQSVPELLRRRNETMPPNMDASTIFRDGTVFVGAKLLRDDFMSSAGYGIPAVLAHEFAHIWQSKSMLDAQDPKWRELHADYMGGWFVSHRGWFRPQTYQGGALAFFMRGDYAFNDADHHGTPEERGRAFDAGFKNNQLQHQMLPFPDAVSAFEAGKAFLASQGARWKSGSHKMRTNDPKLVLPDRFGSPTSVYKMLLGKRSVTDLKGRNRFSVTLSTPHLKPCMELTLAVRESEPPIGQERPNCFTVTVFPTKVGVHSNRLTRPSRTA